MLKEYRGAARKEPGVTISDLLCRRPVTPSRFIVNEVWRNWAAYDAHAKAAPRAQLYAKIMPIQYGPPDRAPISAIPSRRPAARPARTASIIVSHLDVTPPRYRG